MLSVEITSAKFGGFYCKDEEGADLGFITHKIYDSENAEITSSALESTAVKTCVWIRPTHDLEVLGGLFSQSIRPTSDIRLWVTGLPGISNIRFANGGVNLATLGMAPYKITDGRASKFLKYYPVVPDANSFKLTVKHPAAFVHTFQLHLELFKAP